MELSPTRLHHSPQWHQGRFRNETPWQWMSFRDYAGMMFEYVFRSKNRSPRIGLPVRRVDLSHFCSRDSRSLSATWLGHSTVLVNIDGVRIITDPVFEKAITILGPWRYSGKVPLAVEDVPDVDIMILSHNHYDHLNTPTLKALHERIRRIVTPIGVGGNLMSEGVAPDKIVELDWGEVYEDPSDIKITATPAQHFSGRRLNDRDKTLWASFVLQGKHHRVFFGGDSGYFDGFKRIGDRYGPFDLTFVETGAYSRFWRAVHMFPEEAIQAHCDLRGEVLHPIHWGTFDLSLHSWYDPMRRLVAEAKRKGVLYSVPIAGATTIPDSLLHTEEWWEEVLKERG